MLKKTATKAKPASGARYAALKKMIAARKKPRRRYMRPASGLAKFAALQQARATRKKTSQPMSILRPPRPTAAPRTTRKKIATPKGPKKWTGM